MNKDNSNKGFFLEYKGYTAICKRNPNDRNRFYGKPCPPGHPDEPMDFPFAGDNRRELEEVLRSQVDDIIKMEECRKEQEVWSAVNDKDSIGLVFDILPDRFLERVLAGDFDKTLLEGVKGGDYIVPLYYVTKAWDVLLKGSLEPWSFMIGPEGDDDFSEETLKEFMEEECASRSRGQAIIDNDRMKAIWKEQYGIDIDDIEVDFTQYDMHIPPKCSDDTYDNHFLDVPNGIVEWVMSGINHPNGGVAYDSVSSLMEFAALIELVRQDKFCGFC